MISRFLREVLGYPCTHTKPDGFKPRKLWNDGTNLYTCCSICGEDWRRIDSIVELHDDCDEHWETRIGLDRGGYIHVAVGRLYEKGKLLKVYAVERTGYSEQPQSSEQSGADALQDESKANMPDDEQPQSSEQASQSTYVENDFAGWERASNEALSRFESSLDTEESVAESQQPSNSTEEMKQEERWSKMRRRDNHLGPTEAACR